MLVYPFGYTNTPCALPSDPRCAPRHTTPHHTAYPAPLEAPRETRRRLALPGSAVDELERDTFLARTDAFFRTEKTKANPVATAKARAKVVRSTAERKATFMMMCDVENSLIGSWGRTSPRGFRWSARGARTWRQGKRYRPCWRSTWTSARRTRAWRSSSRKKCGRRCGVCGGTSTDAPTTSSGPWPCQG